MPIDPEIHRGEFCPRCGAPMERVIEPYQNPECSQDGGSSVRTLFGLLDNIRSAYNVGAIFRTAEGVGVRHLYLCGFTPTPTENLALAKTGLGAEEDLLWSHHRNALSLAYVLRDKGYRLLALECMPQATPIYRFRGEPPDERPIVLVVGNERAGIDPGLIDLCDEVLALPMAGNKASLNVAVAFGVAAYWLSFV